LAFFAAQARLPQLARAGIVATVLIGVLMHAPTVASFPYHFAVLPHPVFELSLPLVLQGFFAPSVGRLLGWYDWWSFLAFLALLALPWLLRARLETDRPWRQQAQDGAAAGVLAFAWLIMLMAVAPPYGRKAEMTRFRAQSMMGPDADERAGRKAWQRKPD
jgi:hypothetical protein